MARAPSPAREARALPRMNRAFSAGILLLCEFPGRCPRFGMTAAPLALKDTQRVVDATRGPYGLSNGRKASRYRQTRNSSRTVNTSAGGKPSGAMRVWKIKMLTRIAPRIVREMQKGV